MLESLALPEAEFARLKAAADARGIGFLCTSYSASGLDYLESIGVNGYKFASAQIVELSLISHAARFGKPLILSTGMADLHEIDEALNAARPAPVILLQCTTDYPSRVEDANLRTIPALQKRYDVPIGYSDHTTGDTVAIAAVALGASLVEKHLTLDRRMEGPDHAASLDPVQFEKFVAAAREAQAALGSSVKQASRVETANAAVMRRSLHAVRRIPAGTTIHAADVGLKRPNVGLAPRELDRVVGRRARVDIEPETPLLPDLIE